MQKAQRLMWFSLLLPLLAACSGTLNHPMDCNKVLQLRLGQSPDAVRALLGEPAVADDLSRMSAAKLSSFSYGGGRSLRTSDGMYVNFVEEHLVLATAMRDRLVWPGRWETTIALTLGSRDDRLIRTVGRAFMDVFQCGPSFSLERAVRDSGYWTLDEH